MSSRVQLLRRGVSAPPPPREPLRAGPLAMALEGADLRSIRLGDVEIVRHLYVAVRDHNWGTVPATISDRVVAVGPDGRSFSVSFLAEHRRGPIDFAWRGTIRGDADGTIAYRMDGEARSTFLRNRIGICLLHPIRECAGRPCEVDRADGTTVRGAFPDRIAPHQPFKDIRAIAHEVRPGLRAEVRFEGETFEMEDQRNWTDGSFKTYGTPLDLPFPVEVARGARIEQSATIRLIGDVPDAVPSREAGTATVVVGGSPIGRLPRLGLGLSAHGLMPSPREVERLRALNLGHLRIDLDPTRPLFEEVLADASRLARDLGVTLEVAVFVSDAAERELAALARAVDEARPPVASWLVFHVAEKATAGRWVDLAREHLGGAPIGAGSNVYFTELNRGYPPVPTIDLVAYSINPQVHAFDDASIVESLEAQPATVASAKALAGGLPVAVTPITLRPRFNPNATGPEPEPMPGALPSQVDPRQCSLLGAAWTLGSIAALSAAGAASLTYFETIGWRGVMESEEGCPLPDRFPSRAGSVFPMYHVFADVGAFAGSEVVAAASSDPLGVAALGLSKGGRLRVLLANLGPVPRRARVEGLGASARVRLIDDSNADEAMRSPEAFRADPSIERPTPGGAIELELPPFALARVDATDRRIGG